MRYRSRPTRRRSYGRRPVRRRRGSMRRGRGRSAGRIRIGYRMQ